MLLHNLSKNIAIVASLAVTLLTQPLLASGSQEGAPTDESPKQRISLGPVVKRNEGELRSFMYFFGTNGMNDHRVTYAIPYKAGGAGNIAVNVDKDEKAAGSPNLDEED